MCHRWYLNMHQLARERRPSWPGEGRLSGRLRRVHPHGVQVSARLEGVQIFPTPPCLQGPTRVLGRSLRRLLAVHGLLSSQWGFHQLQPCLWRPGGGGSRRVAGYHGFEIQATSYGKVQVQHRLCLPPLPPTPSCGDRPAVSRGTQLFGGLRQSGDAGGVMGVKCQEKSKGSVHPRAPGEPGRGQCPVPSGA